LIGREEVFELALLLLLSLTACTVRRAASASLSTKPPADEVWLTSRQMEEAQISTDAVAVRAMETQLMTTGKIAFDDRRVAHVFSPVTGKVSSIVADPGQRVRRGAALATIESPDVGNAFADLGKAEADFLASEHDLARQKDLYEAHAGAQKDLEIAQDNYGKGKAELERARRKARLFRGEATDAVTQEFVLRAPIDGQVIARNVNPGTEVQGQYSGGTAVELFTVGELDKVWVVADVFEMDLGKIKTGAPVLVHVVAYPDRAFQGRVDWISDTLDPVMRTARVRCSVPNPDRTLKPEMYATIGIGTAGVPAPSVARSAILRMADQNVVFVLGGTLPDGGVRFSRRIVGVNEEEGGEMVPILGGLKTGERVVTSGAILLSGML